MQSNPCNCLYQQKKNVNKPVLKKPVKSKFAAFKASLKSSAAPAQTIEHDWGLFKVTSPLRKPSYHCEGKRDQRQVCLDLMLRTKQMLYKYLLIAAMLINFTTILKGELNNIQFENLVISSLQILQ